eukprot:4083217-Karenia_brevis.AAC.1
MEVHKKEFQASLDRIPLSGSPLCKVCVLTGDIFHAGLYKLVGGQCNRYVNVSKRPKGTSLTMEETLGCKAEAKVLSSSAQSEHRSVNEAICWRRHSRIRAPNLHE